MNPEYPMATPITHEVSVEIGRLAAMWRNGEITVSEYVVRAQRSMDKLGDLEKRLAIVEEGLTPAYLSGFHKRDDEVRELSKDKERLDWLQSQTKGYGTGWLCRDSTTGRGMRLHETSTIGAFPDVRQAIDEAMKGGSNAQP